MSKLFISHATEDRTFVEDELLSLIKALGFDVWFAENKISTAEQWERSIRTALESTKWFLVILSPNSAKSEWVRDELAWAIDSLPHKIVPILIDSCDLRDFHVRLPRIQHIDYRIPTKEAREKLIECLVKGEYKPLSFEDKIVGLIGCPSKEILTVIKLESGDFGWRSTIAYANDHANDFYGLRKGLSITGWNYDQVRKVISRWVEPEDLERFEADQTQTGGAMLRGEELFAKFPLKINDKHPLERMRGRSFLPIGIAYSYPEEQINKTVEYFLIMYLDLNDVSAAIQDSAVTKQK
jgi:hypothetical protein